ncbi:Soluble guanylate cyclase 88E [Tetrabaena socialis]|uniref:Soluble guanylate cyclase 88E n=1 Tax=Tetrabaena socialis TaxID=47790 RepID=A0A2J8AJD8_9CHLO|nr:Soluble guanylate cyclase 88E [Tetrabaena socialis]|eukprot:PNH12624.1 Soluble guanylate cyclase 88E [Tetrabaena socialis]
MEAGQPVAAAGPTADSPRGSVPSLLPGQRRTPQQAMLEALTTSAWSTLLKPPCVRQPPRRNRSAHCLTPSAASVPSLDTRAGSTAITAITATWAGLTSPRDSRRTSLSPLSRATFNFSGLLDSRPSLRSGGDGGTESCASPTCSSRRGSSVCMGATSIGSAAHGSSGAMSRILNIALPLMRGASAHVKPVQHELPAAASTRSERSVLRAPRSALSPSAVSAQHLQPHAPASSAVASRAFGSEIGGEIPHPPATADAGAEAAAVMFARCPASFMSLTPPVPTGSGSHSAAPGGADSTDPDDVSVSLSLPPTVNLMGTIPRNNGAWGGGGAAPVLPPEAPRSQPMLALTMPSVSTLRIAPKRVPLDRYDHLFAIGAVPTAAGAPPSVVLPMLREVPSRAEGPHEALLERWHEVALTSFEHPQLRCQVILVTQNDVSPRIWAERKLALVMQAEHTLLENIFPHHVIEHIAATSALNFDEQRTVPQQQEWQSGVAIGAADVEGDRREQDVGGSVADTTWLPAIRGETFLHLATSHAAITILFCDIQGFTPMCSQMGPVVVMSFLNDLFTRLDGLLDNYGVYKVETVGDCYVAAGGLMRVDEQTGAVTVRSDDVDPLHAYRTVQFAKALLRAASCVILPTTGTPVRLRVGIHSGPAMSGVVGTRMPRFCLFGDTMNVASRMESTGEAGAIHVSQATRDLVPHEAWECRGGTEVKGKGLMETYFLKA